MTRVFARRELTWRSAGDALNLCRGQTVLVSIVPDSHLPGMWRVRHSDGHISDMVNIARAKESGVCIALAELNSQEMRPEGSSVRRTPSPVSGYLPSKIASWGLCGNRLMNLLIMLRQRTAGKPVGEPRVDDQSGASGLGTRHGVLDRLYARAREGTATAASLPGQRCSLK